MRFVITNVTDGFARSVAAPLLAAGHQVIGVDDRPPRHLDPRIIRRGWSELDTVGADAVLHLPAAAGPEGVALREAVGGTRVVIVLPDRPDRAHSIGQEWAGHPEMLMVRTASPAGRRAGPAECRTLLGLARAKPHTEWQLVHPDDVARHLVTELTSGSTLGRVTLVAPGTVNAAQAGALLRRARLTSMRKGLTPAKQPAEPLVGSPGFDTGWTAAEALYDLIRGLAGRQPGPEGAHDNAGTIILPADVIPARLPPGDGHTLTDAAPPGAESELDDRLDARYPVYAAARAGEALPGPLSALSIDLHAGGLRHANAVLAHLFGLDGLAAEEWTSRFHAIFGRRVYLNASTGLLAAANLPGWCAEDLLRQARATSQDNAPPPAGQHPDTAAPHTAAPHTAAPNRAWGRARRRAQATPRLIATARGYRAWARALHAASRVEALDAHEVAALDPAQLHVRALLARDRLQQAWAGVALGMVASATADRLDGRLRVGNRDRQARAGIDLDRLESAGPVLAVERLAGWLRADETARAAAVAGDVETVRERHPELAGALDAEVGRVGHRGLGECELANPVFADRQEALLTAAAHLAGSPPRTPRSGPGTSGRWVTGAAVAHDRARDALARVSHRLRVIVREQARRQVRAGVLDRVEDAFELTLDELFTPPPQAAELVTRRRAERDRLAALRMPAMFTGRWEPVAPGAPLATGESISGTGVSAGSAEGPVKVLTDDAEVDPGDVLVAAVADIWRTVRFPHAAAIVTDGDAGDPAVSIARAFGTPCIAGTRLATLALTDGQHVRVDADAGTVTALTEPSRERRSAHGMRPS